MPSRKTEGITSLFGREFDRTCAFGSNEDEKLSLPTPSPNLGKGVGG
jgi:hypothetical protein